MYEENLQHEKLNFSVQQIRGEPYLVSQNKTVSVA